MLDPIVERMKCYFEANDITDDGKQWAISIVFVVLHVIHLSETWFTQKNLWEKPLNNGKRQCKLIQTRNCQRPVQRFKFSSQVRSPGESITMYMAALRQLAEHCNFSEHLKKMLRDRLVCGINEVKIQRRLLAEAQLTHKLAVVIAVGMQVASTNAQELQHSTETMTVSRDVNRLQTEAVLQKRKAGAGVRECYTCGSKHEASECRFQDAECHKCKKRGHIARKCQRRITAKSVPEPRRHTNQ